MLQNVGAAAATEVDVDFVVVAAVVAAGHIVIDNVGLKILVTMTSIPIPNKFCFVLLLF
jgi:hypothetical protein